MTYYIIYKSVKRVDITISSSKDNYAVDNDHC